MLIEFDPIKNEKNREKHGLSFEQVEAFDWESALVQADVRRDYGEVRLVAIGRFEGRLHLVCFTPRQDTIRVISFRRAHRSEARHYEQAAKSAADE